MDHGKLSNSEIRFLGSSIVPHDSKSLVSRFPSSSGRLLPFAHSLCFSQSPSLLIRLASCCLIALLTWPVFAQPGRDKEELSWDRKISGLFQRYCYDCHGTEDPSGGVNLAQDEHPGLILDHRLTWGKVLKVLDSEQMPPKDESQPNRFERRQMIDFLNELFQTVDCDQLPTPGKPTLRRLNRAEYDNAIFDLTGLDLRLAQNFPPDSVGYGFDNIGDALTLTPTQTEIYHDAAKKIVAQLLDTKHNRFEVYQSIFGVPVDGSAEAGEQLGAPQGLTIDQLTERRQAVAVLRRFSARAFRGPVDEFYINRLLKVYDQSVEQFGSRDVAIGHCLTAILMSPRFLFRIEQDQPNAQRAYLVSQYELASRLSFFLWSRPPDKVLLEQAREGRLHDPQELRKQMSRMLADRRSRALVDNFFSQWLDLHRLDTHRPDPDVFPEFDEELRRAMRDEAKLILLEMIVEDLPVTQLIDSDHTYANSRLAAHYGWPTMNSSEPVRVDLTDRRRGGFLTSAAFLMLQSDPVRTNIPRRGNFIAGQFLGDPPPPPPPGIPPLEDSQDGNRRSLRETFELHRRSPDCKDCHAKIDPLGFSLENFDAIGRWRETDNGLPIDASAELDGAASFEGVVGLKDHLLAHKSQVCRELSSRLLIYALGRGLEASDYCVVDDMVEAAEKNGDRFSTLIYELVTSIPFTHRQNADF